MGRCFAFFWNSMHRSDAFEKQLGTAAPSCFSTILSSSLASFNMFASLWWLKIHGFPLGFSIFLKIGRFLLALGAFLWILAFHQHDSNACGWKIDEKGDKEWVQGKKPYTYTHTHICTYTYTHIHTVHLRFRVNPLEMNWISDQTRLNWFARGEAPRRGGEANNRARS